jgi:DNA processing protein
MTINRHSYKKKTDAGTGAQLFHLLALARIGFLSAREKLLLLDLFEEPGRIFTLSKGQLEILVGRRIRIEKFEASAYLRGAEADARALDGGSTRALFILDDGYPAQLAEIHDPPFLLFYRGMLPVFDLPCIGIVGTRNPTGSGRTAAFRLGLELSANGVPVVSGLARGIDYEAHSGSLEGKGASIAVLGNGIDSFSPKSSEGLGKRILESGGVVFSEYPPRTLPAKYRYPARNRIISGLSRSVVIVQAPCVSGALITAEYALDQGRELFVHRVGLYGREGEGTLRLAHEGAKKVERANDIFVEWGAMDIEKNGIGEPWVSGKEKIPAGARLARILEAELSSSCVTHNGEITGKGVI